MSIYTAQSHSASYALDAPSTAETDASLVGDQSWRCWDLDHADHCPADSRPSDQPRKARRGYVTCKIRRKKRENEQHT